MALTTTTILPDSALNNGFVAGVYGSSTLGNITTSVNDSNNATFVRKDTTAAPLSCQWNFGTKSLSAGKFFWYIEPRVILTSGSSNALVAGSPDFNGVTSLNGANGIYLSGVTINTGGPSTTATFTTSNAHGLAVNDSIVVSGSGTNNLDGVRAVATVPTSTTFTVTITSSTINVTNATVLKTATAILPKYYRQNDGSSLAQANIDNFRFYLADSTNTSLDNRAWIHQVSAVVVEADVPTIPSVLALNTTTSTRPTINWTATQNDGIKFSAFRIAIYPNATTVTTPLETAGWVYDSGFLTQTTLSHVITTDLENSTQYKVYVRGWISLDNTTTQDVATAWSSAAPFTINLTPPTAPTLTASWNSTTQLLSGTVSTTYAATDTVEVERSDDNGTTWIGVRNASRLASGSSIAWSDKEAKRGAGTSGNNVKVRARTVRVTTSGFRLVSTWTTSATVSVTGDNKWWFRNLASGGTDYSDAQVLASPSESREEDIEVVRPIGRSLPVVLHGELGGADTNVAFYVPRARWSAFEAVMNSQVGVVLQSPFGTQRSYAITGRQWGYVGKGDNPDYIASLSLVEIAAGV